MELKPSESEELFLSLGYNRFYDLYDQIIEDGFWEQEAWYRFSRISNIFAVYSELLSYEPFKLAFDTLKAIRPPLESEIGGPLFKFVRNILAHFPLFETWNDVWISKELANWQKKGLTIDRFLKKYSGHANIKYRFWEAEKRQMTYIIIQFPKQYDNNKIYLKDIISEKDGVKFSLILMCQILNLNTQIESIN